MFLLQHRTCESRIFACKIATFCRVVSIPGGRHTVYFTTSRHRSVIHANIRGRKKRVRSIVIWPCARGGRDC